MSGVAQDVEQGLALLEEAAGSGGLRPGAESFVRGQAAAAEAIYRQLLRESPNAVGFELALAELREPLIPLDEAQGLYAGLIDKYPDNPQPRLREALLLSRRNQPARAIERAQAAIAAFPDDLNLRLSLAQLLIRNGEPGAAVEPLEKALAIFEDRIRRQQSQGVSPDQIAAARRALLPIHFDIALALILDRQYDKALRQAAATRQPGSEAGLGTVIYEALARLNLQQAAHAEQLLTELQARQTNLPPQTPLLLALAQLAGGNGDVALATVANAPALNPQTARMFGQLVQSHPRDRLMEVAPQLAVLVQLGAQATYAPALLPLADALLQRLPGDPFVLARRAEALSLMGRHEEAIGQYERIEQAMPEFTAALMAQAALHMAAAAAAATRDPARAAEHRAAAERISLRLLQQAPESRPALEQLAGIRQLEGRFEEANQVYRRLIEIDPANWSAYNNLAWNLAEGGQPVEAAAYAQKALDLAPEAGGIQDTLGSIELRLGHVDRAVELLRSASLRVPNDPDVRYHLAQALEARGQIPEAAATLESIVLATPHYEKIDAVKRDLDRLK
jgi:tetratricopeptide (TPR) repeat protein